MNDETIMRELQAGLMASITKAYLRPLTEARLIVRTDPDHPNSPRQKYALTKAGSERIRRVAPL